jgi:hypothetical protein
LEHLVPSVLSVREDDGNKLGLLVFERGSSGGRCRSRLPSLNDLDERAWIDTQERPDSDEHEKPNAPACKLGPGAHASPVFDVRALFSASPAQIGLSIPELRLEFVLDALAAALEETRQVLRANRDFAKPLCERSAGLRTDIAVDIDPSVFLKVANRSARSLAHHAVMLSGLVPANVERLLQCCDVVI